MILVAAVLFATAFAAARLNALTAPAKIAFIEGQVKVLRNASTVPVDGEVGMSLFFGDQVKTLKTGKCQVNMTASGILRLSPSTTVLLPVEENTADKISVVRMLEGKTWSNIKQLSKDEVFEVRTPSLVAAVQGTKLIVEYNPRTKVATLIVEEGKVRGIMTAAGKEIEKLITTAKQVSINAQTGVITAIVDADLTKIRNEFGDQIFKGSDNVIEEIFLTLTSPMDDSEVTENTLPVSGSVSDPTVREITVTIGGADNEQARRVRIPVKNGKFEGQVEVAEGETKLEFEIRNPAGKKTNRTVKVRRVNRGDAFQVFIDAPATGTTITGTATAVEGRVSGGPESVKLSVNGKESGSATVKSGKFSATVKLAVGKNDIEVTATLRDKTARAAVEVKCVPGTTNPNEGGGLEQAPTPPVLIFQEAGSRGAFNLVGTVMAMPAVKEIAVYIDGRLYKKDKVENNQFKVFVQLNDVVSQITLTPIWKDREYTAASAVYTDKKAPDVNITLPIANTTYDGVTQRVELEPNGITVQGLVMDELLKSIEYKINLDIPRTATFSGVNTVSLQQPIKMYEGQNSIYIIAKDFFGNVKQSSVVVYWELPKQSKVVGGIVDQFTGKPISQAKVQLVPIGGQNVAGVKLWAATDSQGRYTLSGIPEGRYILIIARDNYLPGQKEITVKGTLTNVPATVQSIGR